MRNWFIKEMVLKLDFENDEFEIGWIWIFFLVIKNVIEWTSLN